jgi:hypothetical protein
MLQEEFNVYSLFRVVNGESSRRLRGVPEEFTILFVLVFVLDVEGATEAEDDTEGSCCKGEEDETAEDDKVEFEVVDTVEGVTAVKEVTA